MRLEKKKEIFATVPEASQCKKEKKESALDYALIAQG